MKARCFSTAMLAMALLLAAAGLALRSVRRRRPGR
jgi:hypothetical protein